ncbi:mechanosensitive ion channel family protein [Neptuniibacter sp.]|uniref:mechanosensitive ion channel family protein n=1 Tax=Neptuniibacter sp. TaxID=1962643 RepID=UPI002616CE01|nr:mechanosensitive ion channel family protein [Neptuniibacter sp.]MCP4595882.1 mechanosensitive ion channel family protein [Neptuniibacter sp.]
MEQEIQNELETITRLTNMVIDFFVNYSFQVIGAIIIFLLGLFVARSLAKFALKLCEKHSIDVTLSLFIASTVKLLIIAMILVICLGKFGISVAPFVAAIGAISLSAGLALQGVFSNYGAGFTIILTRPFVVENTIEINGISGIVKEIKLAYTVLSTEDGEMITIPNKHIVGEVITNSFEYKVVEASIGISYDSEPEQAIELISQCLEGFDEIPESPAPQIGIEVFADSSVNIAYRYWVPTERFFEVQYQVNLSVFNALKQAQIDIPFPQREVMLKQA